MNARYIRHLAGDVTHCYRDILEYEETAGAMDVEGEDKRITFRLIT